MGTIGVVVYLPMEQAKVVIDRAALEGVSFEEALSEFIEVAKIVFEQNDDTGGKQ